MPNGGRNEKRTAGGGLRILALVMDAHGGFGGVAQHNRICFDALCSFDSVSEIHVLPRMKPEPVEEKLDPKLVYSNEGAGHVATYALRSLLYGLRIGPIDLVLCTHIHLIPVAAAIATLKRAPLALTIHGTDAWMPAGRLPKSILRRVVSCVMAVSGLTLDRFLAWSNFPRGRAFVIPNAIVLSDYGAGPKSEALVARHGLQGKTVLLSVGRMDAKARFKGFDRMIDTLPSLIEEVPDVVYLMVGDGTEQPLLEKQVAELGLEDRAVFAGRVSEEEKAEYYRLADAFVMLSVGDGFGFVVIEALACGVPVVVSSKDGTREAALNGELGVVVDPFDQAEVRRGIHAALATPRGVPAGLQYFTHDRFADRLKHALSSVCRI